MAGSFRCALACLLSVSLACGCATGPILQKRKPVSAPAADAADCEQLYRRIDEAIKYHGVRDGQALPVTGFPYLRTDRFLASFKYQTLDDGASRAWLDYLQRAGERGLTVELSNLDPSIRDTLPAADVIHDCTGRLRRQDFGSDESPDKRSLKKLAAAIQVADEYQTWKRVAGLYWLTAWGVKWGTGRLHRKITNTYQAGIQDGNRIKYLPPRPESRPDAGDISSIMKRAYRNNALGIPEPDMVDQARLFAAYAPTIVVDTKTDNDRIGSPAWHSSEPTPVIDTANPVVYRLISHTRFHGKILLQLNYIFWFPARPKLSGRDYLGGHLDGLTWRITLSETGEPLAYDSIHNCGCYHLFFPTSFTCVTTRQGVLQEPAFSYQSVADGLTGETHTSLYIAHTSHFLERVHIVSGRDEPSSADPETAYRWAEYDTLRSIANADGTRRSLFQENGIVKGTQRNERYFLWPMGIPDPGAMRQWGHHATAFFGRRHFDDPDIIERSFQLNTDGMCR